MRQIINKVKKEWFMGKFLIIIILLAICLAGCSNEVVVNPELTGNALSYKLIKLPNANKMQINETFFSSKEISGNIGGTIYLQGSYSGGPYGLVTVNSELAFPAGAFSGTKQITVTADDGYCASSFQPGMCFSKAGIYNITYTGVDLSNINPAAVKFVYLRNDGSLEYPFHEGISTDLATGTISVKNARLNHFSRYGFIN